MYKYIDEGKRYTWASYNKLHVHNDQNIWIFLFLWISWMLPYYVIVFGFRTESKSILRKLTKVILGFLGRVLKFKKLMPLFIHTTINCFECNMNRKQINVISFDLSIDQLFHIVASLTKWDIPVCVRRIKCSLFHKKVICNNFKSVNYRCL